MALYLFVPRAPVFAFHETARGRAIFTAASQYFTKLGFCPGVLALEVDVAPDPCDGLKFAQGGEANCGLDTLHWLFEPQVTAEAVQRASAAHRAGDVVVRDQVRKMIAAAWFGASVEQFRALVEKHFTRRKRDFMASIDVVLDEQPPGALQLL